MPENSTLPRHYYADGVRVPLVPSTHFVAVRAKPEDAEVLAERSMAASIDLQRPVRALRIPDQDLVVFEVDDAGNGAALPLKARSTDVTSGPDVYEPVVQDDAMRADGHTALIDNGQLIVKLDPGTASNGQLIKTHHLEMVQTDYPEPGANLLRVTREQDSALAIANELHESAGIEFAVPNFVRLTPRLSATLEELENLEDLSRLNGTRPAFTANDPLLSAQWGIHKIRCPEAWDISRGSADISVAIIDEGGNDHEDYVQAPGFDATTDDNDPSPNPTDGHGVACAGIVTATAHNGRGIAGVAPNAKVRHIRIAHGLPGGRWATDDAKTTAGIRRAVDLGADVLSNSWGGGAPSTVITNAFKYAQTTGRGGRGTPIAVATGNDDAARVSYPANLSPMIPGLLAVGASNQWDQRKSKTSLDGESWWGSNYGPEMDVVAPGVKIPTTDIMGSGGYGASNYINDFRGTSSATPHVAGLMALILAVDPQLRSWEVEDIIKLTAKDLGGASHDQHHGFGRIDARAALEAAKRLWYSTKVAPVFLGSGQEAFIRVSLRIFNPGINTVRLNNLTFRSHAADDTVLDEFTYQGNPGPVMLARSGHDALFNDLLLRARGTRASWSYRWTVKWTYTFWRPSAPVFPLGAGELGTAGVSLDESQGHTDIGDTLEGGDSGRETTPEAAPELNGHKSSPLNGTSRDRVILENAGREITIVLR